MNILLKAAGLAALFFCSCFLGFAEAEKLKNRVRCLSHFVRALAEFSERVRTGSEEIDRLLVRCFGEDCIRRDEDGFRVLPFLKDKEDACLAEEFFRDVGMSNAGGESERAKLYGALFSGKLAEAEKDAKERCRLFRTLGVLGGCFLCIFLL